jgi:hypothetical protein
MRSQTLKIKLMVTMVVTLLFTGVVHAQSINVQSDNITWTINGMTDVDAGVTVAYQCKFTTFGNQNIDWIQDNGNYVVHFSILSTDGLWTNPDDTGSITYTISGSGLTGTFTISNSGTSISASLHLTGGTGDINHIYPVQSYEKI